MFSQRIARVQGVHAPAGYRPAYVGFYRGADEIGPPVYSDRLPAIDEDGRLVWKQATEAPYSEVVRAAEAGVLVGDPSRPHIAMVAPIGNGALPDWQTIVHAYEISKEIWEVIALPGGAYATWRLIKALAQRRADRGIP